MPLGFSPLGALAGELNKQSAYTVYHEMIQFRVENFGSAFARNQRKILLC